MLKTRLLTAIILIPLFILLVLKVSNVAFALLTAAFVLIGSLEWSKLMGLQSKAQRFCYLFVIFLCMKIALSVFVPYILFATLLFWILVLVLVARYPNGALLWSVSRSVRGAMGIMVLVPAWVAINFIRLGVNGPLVLLYLCVLIWGADTGAYFAGKLWGKTKLAPAVSPGKTREGLVGALLITTFIAFFGMFWHILPISTVALFILAWVTVLFSVLGDLFESMLKRNAGVKDSGNLIPGHGGLLDRIDSLTAAAPIFALGYLLALNFFH